MNQHLSIAEVIEETHSKIKEYQSIRMREKRGEPVRPIEVQEIRDDLSTALAFFIHTYADLKHESDRLQSKLKIHFAERYTYWIDHYKETGVKKTAEYVKQKAQLDCKELMEQSDAAYAMATKAKGILDRTDQIINGIASRLKFHIKHDYHE